MALREGFKLLAVALQEADDELSHNDVRARLNDELSDMSQGGPYCCLVDYYGDDENGDVVYYCGGQLKRANYTISAPSGGKQDITIDDDNALNVVPRTSYEEEAPEDDGVSEAAGDKRIERFPGSALWTHAPLAERFISKGERDSADASDFAGAGKSFPILRKTDVMAAVRSIGRGVAGGQSASALKSKIKAIAKKKGFGDALPDAWKDDDSKESKRGISTGVTLIESAFFPTKVEISESAAQSTYLAKLIQPGRGSSGYYPEEVLKRDGPQIFKAGTHMYINHATDAEEAQRPEGDWTKLASVLSADAYYDATGKAGAGLYAPIKVFSDYAPQIKEKAAHSGVSIRAVGERDDKKLAPDGKPGIITKLSAAYSVDHVTHAGAGGKLLTESAKGENEMDEAQVKALIKESQAPLIAENKRLREHLALTQAPQLIREALQDIRLPEPAKRRIIERLAPAAPMGEDGKIDSKKLGEMVEAEAKIEAGFLSELGLGSNVASIGVRMNEKDARKAEEQTREQFDESMSVMADIFVGPKLSKGGDESAREARKLARKGFKEGRAA